MLVALAERKHLTLLASPWHTGCRSLCMDELKTLYLLGCFATLFLTILKITLIQVGFWFVNEQIYRHNIAKISVYFSPITGHLTHEKTKLKTIVFTIFLDCLLSWINVVFVTFQICMFCLILIKFMFRTAPPSFQEILFPLRNDPSLDPEMVWARIIAVGNYGHAQPTASNLKLDLDTTSRLVPGFSRAKALACIRALKFVPEEELLLLESNSAAPYHFYDPELT
jgi:hypothetical protein